METYESVLLVKSEVFVFKIPPRPSNRGHRLVQFYSHIYIYSQTLKYSYILINCLLSMIIVRNNIKKQKEFFHNLKI